MVKIANKNKKDAYRRFIGRTGKGSTRMPDKEFDKRLLDIMHAKPYGGSVASKSTVKEEAVTASESITTGRDAADATNSNDTSGGDTDHGSDKTESPD